MMLTAAEIAKRLGCRLEGDGAAGISGPAGIREARPGQISFIGAQRYAAAAATTRAAAVIVGEDWNRPCPAALIRAKDPEKAFAEVSAWFAPPPVPARPGIHPSAIVAENVELGKDVSIGAYCIVEPGASLGDRTAVSAFCYIGHGSVIGEDCKLYQHVGIREYSRIGDRAIVHNGAVIGSDGFGYRQEGAVRRKIPQTGIVVIGDDVEIGANVTIDRARFGETRIGNGVKIDNLVQVAHNVIIGDNSVIVGQAGISGSAFIGERAVIAGQAGIAGHIAVGDDAVVGGQSGVSKDIPPGSFVFGTPAAPFEKVGNIRAHVNRLPELKKKVAEMEQRLAALETNGKNKPRCGEEY